MNNHQVTLTLWDNEEVTIDVLAASAYSAARRALREADAKFATTGTLCVCVDGSGNIACGTVGVAK